jgi:hypothetical protein
LPKLLGSLYHGGVAVGAPNDFGSGRRLSAGDGAPRRSIAASYGFRRIERVHFRVTDQGTLATVTGTTHRYPRSIRVPVSIAHRLVAAGAPVIVEQDGHDQQVVDE